MEHTRPYEKLIVWQEAHELCLFIYRVSKSFPSDEKYGLVSQMRRSSASVPTNIAEGNSKRSKKDKAHFFETAACSLEELHYQCRLSHDLTYLSDTDFDEAKQRIQRTGYLLNKLYNSIA